MNGASPNSVSPTVSHWPDRWPLGIAVALLLVVAVQLAFAWVAVENADSLAPSYAAEKR